MASAARGQDPNHLDGHLKAHPGDVLLNSTGTGTIGRSCVFNDTNSFVVDSHVTVLRPIAATLHPQWLNALLRSPQGQSNLETFCYAGSTNQVELARSPLVSTEVPLPPLPEQRRIAEILDTLDRTIASTQRIIEKLQATRQGLLHDLLTRGLDEHGQLRDPERNPEQFKETELGRLPRSWMVDYLNQDVYFQEGPGLREWQFRETGLPFLNIRCLEDGFIDKSKAHCISIEEANSSYSHFFLDAGDFVMSSSGTLGRISEVRQPDLPLMLNTSVIRFRPRKASLNSRFLWWVLQSTLFFEQITRESQGSAQANFGPSHLDKVRVALPDLPEQQRIAASLDSFTQTYKAEQNRLAKLQALKRGLMDDLLTGRVRVPTTPDSA